MTTTQKYVLARESARRYQDLVHARARRVFGAAFSDDGRIWADGSCFLYAHNWQTLPNLTPEQRSACRTVGYLERRMWDACRLRDAWYTRVLPFRAGSLSTVEG